MTAAVDVQGADVWDALTRALDIGLLRPTLDPSIDVARFTTRWGGDYAVAKNPRGLRYFRFSGEDGELLTLLDGTRTVRELIVDRLQVSDSFDVDTLVSLVELLLENDFLTTRWVDVYELVDRRLQGSTRRVSGRLRRLFREQTVQLNHVDELVGWIYRHGGRLVFNRWVNVGLVAAAVGGLVLFVLDVKAKHFTLSSKALATTFGLVFLFNILVTMVHELGHALGVRHAGKHINGAGFMLFFGSPAFFVESSDMLLAQPRQRIIQSWFGPYMDLVISGVCAALVWFFPDAGSAQALFNFAALGFLAAAINLIPFLELDGYWVLMDALHTTDLRPRSLSFLRHGLPRKIRRRERLTGFEVTMLVFGVLGVVFTVIALVASYLFWEPIFAAFVTDMWTTNVVTKVLLVVLGVVVLGPLAHGAAQAGRTAGRRLRFVGRRLRFRVERRWRIEAGELISQLPLLEGVPRDALNELAGRVRLRRCPAGEDVVAQGDRATEFFVIRSGRVQFVDLTPGGDEIVLRHMSRGEAFGELALLQSTTRTATARAETDVELFVIDKGSFDRLLADHVRVPELAPTMSALTDVWSLPPFRHLSAADARRVVDAGAWSSIPSETDVVTEGAPGDAFYVVGDGRLEVTERGRAVRDLGRGDHFGEIALLLDVPRTATVRTQTPTRLFRLDRAAFEQLVAGSFHAGAVRSAADYTIEQRD